MSIIFEHISVDQIKKEISAIEKQKAALGKKEELLRGLLALSVGGSKTPEPTPVMPEFLTQMSAVFSEHASRITLRDRVVSILQKNNGLQAREIVSALQSAHPELKQNENLQAAIYTVFNRNKGVFRNQNGAWYLSSSSARQ